MLQVAFDPETIRTQIRDLEIEQRDEASTIAPALRLYASAQIGGDGEGIARLRHEIDAARARVSDLEDQLTGARDLLARSEGLRDV